MISKTLTALTIVAMLGLVLCCVPEGEAKPKKPKKRSHQQIMDELEEAVIEEEYERAAELHEELLKINQQQDGNDKVELRQKK